MLKSPNRYMGHISKVEESWFSQSSSQSFSLTTVRTDNEKGPHDWKASTGNTVMSENKRSCEDWVWSDRNYRYQKNLTVVRETRWLVRWKDRIPLMWKRFWPWQQNQWIQTDISSNDKKLTSLETLNYITMYLHMAKETNKFLMSNGKSRHY